MMRIQIYRQIRYGANRIEYFHAIREQYEIIFILFSQIDELETEVLANGHLGHQV